jgi:hypothetical protein
VFSTNDRYFGAAAMERARGAQPGSAGWPEYNGGIQMPRRWSVPVGQYIYRFTSSQVPYPRRSRGEWWIEYEVLQRIKRFAREQDLTPRDAVRRSLALPWSWTAADRLVRAQVVQPLDAYRGLGKSAHGDQHIRDKNIVIVPPTYTQELYQLFIPGMTELAPSVLSNLSETDVWSSLGRI